MRYEFLCAANAPLRSSNVSKHNYTFYYKYTIVLLYF